MSRSLAAPAGLSESQPARSVAWLKLLEWQDAIKEEAMKAAEEILCEAESK